MKNNFPDGGIPQLPELTGLAERTNLVFQSVMGNDVLYERPGATLEFSVHENPYLIRFRLVQVHEDFVMLNTVMEQTTSETHFEIQLPNQENVLYILSLEAVNEQKETIDTAIYLIEAVPQVVNAELSLDQTIFRANQTIISGQISCDERH